MDSYPGLLLPTQLAEAVESLRHIPWDALHGQDAQCPVFVFSSGHRSGSTLMQRLVCSGHDCLIWGEPFERVVPLARMASMIQYLPKIKQKEESLAGYREGSSLGGWIGDKHPTVRDFWHAHRDFFLALLKKTVPSFRWGAKWVLHSADYHLYLRWLFPEAKAICIVRDPRDCLQSYMGLPHDNGDKEKTLDSSNHGDPFGEHALGVLDEEYIFRSPENFIQHWKYLAQSFLRCKEARYPGMLFLRYEDLVQFPDYWVGKLSEFMGTKLDSEVMKRKVGSSLFKERHVQDYEFMIRQIAGKEMEGFGYE